MKTEMQLVKSAVKSASEDKSQQLHQLETKLEILLDGATSHDEIRKILPNCEDFFKQISSEDFVSLLNTTESKAIHIALWYHYGKIMQKAIDKCALASKERMVLLYPLFRLYADESDTYI
jgi:hypothetical protein